jgi:hypothetical protein
MAAENIAAGTKTWAETFHMWQTSPATTRTCCNPRPTLSGLLWPTNERTRYKTYWAMVIAEKPSKKKEPKVAAERKTAERNESAGSSENPISTIKNFVCKYLC